MGLNAVLMGNNLNLHKIYNLLQGLIKNERKIGFCYDNFWENWDFAIL